MVALQNITVAIIDDTVPEMDEVSANHAGGGPLGASGRMQRLIATRKHRARAPSELRRAPNTSNGHQAPFPN